MNKQEVEALIDKLANKELSFGCRVRIKRKASCHPECSIYTNGTIVSRKQKGVYHVVYSNNKDVILNDTEWSKVLGHPVLIGDVLEKLPKIAEVCASGQGVASNFVEQWQTHGVIERWYNCGFTKSLNEIMEDSGFEEVPPYCDENIGVVITDGEQLKDPNARALFEFLNSIF